MGIDKTDYNYKVGVVVKFKSAYSSLLRATTSAYVEKEYV